MRHAAIVHAGWGKAARTAASAHELLGIVFTAHCELTEAASDQTHQLRALLLRGDGKDRTLGRSGLSHGTMSALAWRRSPRGANDQQLARNAEIRRLAQIIIAYRNELSANRDQMAMIVNELAPGITAQPGMGPFKAAKAILDSARLASQEAGTYHEAT
jgi:hypothetical protein